RRPPGAAGERAHRGRDAAQHDPWRGPVPGPRRSARGPGGGRGRRLHARRRDARGAAGPGRRRPPEQTLMRWLLAVALVALPPLARAEARKTLEECIEIALRQQPTLRAAAATVAAGRERVWAAAAAYLPQVSASYLASRRRGSPSSLTNISAGGGEVRPLYSTAVALSQVLFDFGQNLQLIHAAQASAEALAADAD